VEDLFQEGDLDDQSTHTHLGENWGNPSVCLNVFVFALHTFVASAVCITLPISNGLVTPVFAIGAAVGRIYGEAVQWMHGSDSGCSPGGYAVVGAAAVSAAVTGKISIAVVIFELTSELDYAVPVLLAVLVGVVCSRVVSQGSIYDQIGTTQHSLLLSCVVLSPVPLSSILP
jgi:chloride channel 2